MVCVFFPRRLFTVQTLFFISYNFTSNIYTRQKKLSRTKSQNKYNWKLYVHNMIKIIDEVRRLSRALNNKKDGAKSHTVRNVNGKKYNATKSKIRRLIRVFTSHKIQTANRNAVRQRSQEYWTQLKSNWSYRVTELRGMSLDLSYKNKTSIQSNTINDANADTHHRKFVHNAYKRTHNLGTCINKWISKSKHKQTKIVFTRAASASSPGRQKNLSNNFRRLLFLSGFAASPPCAFEEWGERNFKMRTGRTLYS